MPKVDTGPQGLVGLASADERLASVGKKLRETTIANSCETERPVLDDAEDGRDDPMGSIRALVLAALVGILVWVVIALLIFR